MTTDNLKRLKDSSNHFEAVKINGYWLSIQGSEGYYCTPKKTLPSRDYISFEMMIFKEGNPNFNYKKSKVFRNFPRFNELVGYAPYPDGVHGWIPKDLVDDLITYLKENTNEQV